MGGRTDALKLISSLTLFHAAAQRLADEGPNFAYLVELFALLLEGTSAYGYPPCAQTLARGNNITGPGGPLFPNASSSAPN
jgi:hypothetical protein